MSTTGVPSKPCVTALTCDALYSASTFSFMICIACSTLMKGSQVHSKIRSTAWDTEASACCATGRNDCALQFQERWTVTFVELRSYKALLLSQFVIHNCSCANGFAVQVRTASIAHGDYQSTKELDTAWCTMQLISRQYVNQHQCVTTCQSRFGQSKADT